ncbi:MAG: LysR family transcriptional regulator [Alphaproteobacteria bacterium]
MQDLNDLYFFVQVVDHGGFAPAGRALGLPKSRLSRRIGLLEERLGVRLIQRSTRRFVVTDIGQEYHRHCVAMLVEAEAAEEAIQRSHSEPQGIVKVSCPPALLCFQVGDMIARYMTAFPLVTVHLESTSREVDVVAEGFDVAIRVRFPPIAESDLVMRRLAPSTQRLVASPSLLDGHASPLVPADLAALPSVDFAPSHRTHQWCLEGANGAESLITHQPRLITDDMIQMRLAALSGIGVVQLPTMMVADDLAAGTLVDVMPAWRPRSGIVHAVFASRRGLLPAVRKLIDHLSEEFSQIAARRYLGGGSTI